MDLPYVSMCLNSFLGFINLFFVGVTKDADVVLFVVSSCGLVTVVVSFCVLCSFISFGLIMQLGLWSRRAVPGVVR